GLNDAGDADTARDFRRRRARSLCHIVTITDNGISLVKHLPQQQPVAEWQPRARHGAGDLGATISPLANTDRKGGAFPIMHRQFLRAVGVTAATGNAALKLKLSRIHYLRSTQRNEKQKQQHTRQPQTTANIDPITLINAELAGTSAMPTRDMADSNSSRMDDHRAMST
ncbi:hypothetical protein THAOC_09078, partial [Thalassiosira oceanica]